jgi:dTDP-glucose 4,6-dehydratase
MKSTDNILLEDMEVLTKRHDWSGLYNSSVFITGATGFIGRQLVFLLLYLNETLNASIIIYICVRDLKKATAIFGEKKAINFVVGDVRQPFQPIDETDYVIHGANITQSKIFVDNPVETIDTAYLGTRNILEFVRNKKVKSIVYLSSMEVFGVTDPQLAEVRESDYGYIDILNPRSSYSESKRMCECLCVCHAKEYEIPVKIARLVQTLGAGMDYNDTRVTAQFARSVIENKDIVLKTAGLTRRPIIYTRDAISGIFTVLLKGAAGAAYNVANKTTICTIRETAEMIASKIAENKIKVRYGQNKPTEYAPDINLNLNTDLIESLGWQAEVGLEESYRRMIESMKHNVKL